MLCVRHSQWHNSVRRHGEGLLLAETFLLSTGIECSARLTVDSKSFIIKKGVWEIYRGTGVQAPKRRELPELTGEEAYFSSGPVLKTVLGDEGGGLALSLFQETVRGIIQAETFLYRERGYADAKSYDSYWEKFYAGACRYYSNLDRVTKQWADHVEDQKRFHNLFNRIKHVSVYLDEQGGLLANAGFSDSFHELGLILSLNTATGEISGASSNLLRAPDPVCLEAAQLTAHLNGLQAAGITKKQLAQTLGAGQGCVHIIDLAHDTLGVLQSCVGDIPPTLKPDPK